MKQKMKQKIWPSVVAKNQKELDGIFDKLNGVSETLHLDIVDGKFADNHSLDFNFKLSSNFNYTAHLMIKNPEKWIEKHGQKVDFYIPHIEEINDVKEYIKSVRMRKKKVAFALRIETEISSIKPFLHDVDYVLILTVHPGFYGSDFVKTPLKKIKQIKKVNPKIKVIVDGHMDSETIKEAKNAGADYFVSGSFIQKAESPKKAIKELNRVISL